MYRCSSTSNRASVARSARSSGSHSLSSRSKCSSNRRARSAMAEAKRCASPPSMAASRPSQANSRSRSAAAGAKPRLPLGRITWVSRRTTHSKLDTSARSPTRVRARMRRSRCRNSTAGGAGSLRQRLGRCRFRAHDCSFGNSPPRTIAEFDNRNGRAAEKHPPDRLAPSRQSSRAGAQNLHRRA